MVGLAPQSMAVDVIAAKINQLISLSRKRFCKRSNECQKFQKLGTHPHIVEFIEDFKDSYVEYGLTTEVYCVVTAFVEGKTLFKLIEELKLLVGNYQKKKRSRICKRLATLLPLCIKVSKYIGTLNRTIL